MYDCIDSCNQTLIFSPASNPIHSSDDGALESLLHGVGNFVNPRPARWCPVNGERKLLGWPRCLRIDFSIYAREYRRGKPMGEETGTQDTIVGCRADRKTGARRTRTRFGTCMTHPHSFGMNDFHARSYSQMEQYLYERLVGWRRETETRNGKSARSFSGLGGHRRTCPADEGQGWGKYVLTDISCTIHQHE